MAHRRRHYQHVAFVEDEVALRRVGHPRVLHLDLSFVKSRRAMAIGALGAGAILQVDAHVIVDEYRQLFGIAITGQIGLQQF
jgi:hypothetical protein